MLTTREAIKIGKRGGNARARNLSAEKRSEVARWARDNREQSKRGETTSTEQRKQFIGLVRAVDPDLAALLRFLSRLPAERAVEICRAMPSDWRNLTAWAACQVLDHKSDKGEIHA
jgi:hypothetical protein